MNRLRQWRASNNYRKAYSRLAQKSTPVVTDWADTTLWATQEGIQGFRATADRAALVEAQTGAVSLLAALDVLLDKIDNVAHS